MATVDIRIDPKRLARLMRMEKRTLALALCAIAEKAMEEIEACNVPLRAIRLRKEYERLATTVKALRVKSNGWPSKRTVKRAATMSARMTRIQREYESLLQLMGEFYEA